MATSNSTRPSRVQPVREHLRRERWSIRAAAVKIEVPPGHLAYAVRGWATPSQEVRDRLPALLGVPLSDLFEPWLLDRNYGGHRNGHAKRALA